MFSLPGTGGHLPHSKFPERGSQRTLTASAVSHLSSTQNNYVQVARVGGWHVTSELLHAEGKDWIFVHQAPGGALDFLAHPFCHMHRAELTPSSRDCKSRRSNQVKLIPLEKLGIEGPRLVFQ